MMVATLERDIMFADLISWFKMRYERCITHPQVLMYNLLIVYHCCSLKLDFFLMSQ